MVLARAVMVPSTALAIPTYLLFAEVGLVNTPWAIVPLVIAFLLLQRYWQSGPATGSVKQ